jgi:hypothetical protein
MHGIKVNKILKKIFCNLDNYITLYQHNGDVSPDNYERGNKFVTTVCLHLTFSYLRCQILQIGRQ